MSISLGKLRRPRAYRYRVADRGFRWVWNTYPGNVCAHGRTNVIGAALVIGSYAYCVRWASATSRTTLEYIRDEIDGGAA